MDPQGDAVAVWERFNGTGWLVEASGRPAGAAKWTPASAPLSGEEPKAVRPQVAIDSHGDAVAVWMGTTKGGEPIVESASRQGLNGAWQIASAPLSKPGVVGENPPDVAMDSQGDAIAVWQSPAGGGDAAIEAAGRSAGSGTWHEPVVLSKTASDINPAHVRADANGDALAVWEEHEGLEIVIDSASGKASSAELKGKTRISPPPEGHNANVPELATAPNGEAVAIWERFIGTEVIEAAMGLASSGKWQGSVAVSNPALPGEPGGQEVAIGGQGEAVVVWQRLAGANDDLVEATATTATHAWEAPVVISPPAGNTEVAPQVGLGPAGEAIVVWERNNGKHELIEASTRSGVGGTWQSAVKLSTEGEGVTEPEVAVDGQGNAATVWKLGAPSIIEAAGYDAAGPLLDSLSIPSSGVVGNALSFSVSPLDVWSSLGATSWSFGDGASQAGTSVTHAYSAPGSYSVTVTGADVLGNLTSASATVTITSPPVAPLLRINPGGSLVLPVISGARLSNARFRVAKRPTAVAAARKKAPQGTTFHFTLSEAASVKIAFTRSAPGLRSGRTCVAPTAKLRRKHAKRCSRTLKFGTLTRAKEGKGGDSVAFSGRVGAKPLGVGAYKATLVAVSSGLSSKPATLSFAIVR